MEVKVDKTLCIGCGLCEGLEPELFQLGSDGLAEVVNDAKINESGAMNAAEACPVDAIKCD